MRALTRRRPARPRREEERGQALVIFVGALSTLLVAAGLVVDGGVAFRNRREAQNVADLASLAGTRVVADHYVKGGRSGSDVYRAVLAIANSNGCFLTGDAPCSWTAQYIRMSGRSEQSLGAVSSGGSIPSGAQGVSVDVLRTPDTFFLALIGRPRWDVGAQSGALTARMTGLPPGQVLPIGVDPPNNDFKASGVYELTAGKDGPGNFSWLSWNGRNDAGNLAAALCDPNNPAITFPAWIDGDPGKTNASSVRRCVDKWIVNGTTVLIPLWDEVRGQGNNFEYRIRGVGAFVLLARGNPAIDTITARFVEYFSLPTLPSGYGGPPCAPGSDACGDQTVFVGVVR